MKRLTVLLACALLGCAAHGERAEIARECRQPGRESDMRCAHPSPRSPGDLVKVCEKWGSITKRCYYVERNDLERLLRELNR